MVYTLWELADTEWRTRQVHVSVIPSFSLHLICLYDDLTYYIQHFQGCRIDVIEILKINKGRVTNASETEQKTQDIYIIRFDVCMFDCLTARADLSS